MVKTQLKGVNRVRKRLSDGRTAVYFYHRATGTRLSGIPNSPEFAISYATAEQKVRQRHKGTFSWLFLSYIISPEFSKLAPRTQESYKRSLGKAEAKFGEMPIAVLNDSRIKQDLLAWRAVVANESGERESDNRLSAVSAMVSWAVQNGLVTTNHVKGFKRLYHTNRADLIWSEDDVSAFMKTAPIEMQQAMLIALHTGLRQGDILNLPWSAYDGSHLTVRIRKNQRNGLQAKPTRIPCTEALKAMLDGMERRSPLILTTRQGRAFKPRYFGLCWQRAAASAPLVSEGLHFHDLRGTAVTLLAEAGCTIPVIVAITGHTLQSATKILHSYLGRTSGLGEEAISRFENAPATKFANRMQTKNHRKGG